MSAQIRSEIEELLHRHGLAPSHRLGQHFLADGNITRKIVALARLQPGERVVEVGAGTGTLTRALASTGVPVVTYEIDPGLAGVVAEVIAGLEVEIRNEDITDVDLSDIFADGDWVMVANLPYNIGTGVVLDALRRAPAISRFVVMIQREVALRLTAGPGSPHYGLPSVIAGLHARSELAFSVPPQVFVPPPRVESAVVVLERESLGGDVERAVALARAGFAHRRKMLRRSLDQVLPDPAAALQRAGLSATARAEELSPDDYLRLAEVST